MAHGDFVNQQDSKVYNPAGKVDHQDVGYAYSSRGLALEGLKALTLSVGDHVMEKPPCHLKWAASTMAGEDSKSHSSTARNTGVISTKEHSTESGRKRKTPDRKSQFPDDGHEDDQSKRPKHKERGEHLQTSKKFACPFYKHNSQKYMQNPLTGSKFRACAGPGWQSVHRVKEHIYRRHMPIRCMTCDQEFDSTSALEHHRAAERCEVLETKPPADGITPHQEKQLKSKKKHASGYSEEEKWRDIYQILFPGESIPSPFYDYDYQMEDWLKKDHPHERLWATELDGGDKITEEADSQRPLSRQVTQYEEYCERELPRLISRQIETAVESELRSSFEKFQSQITDIMRDKFESKMKDIVRDCLAQLLTQYQQLHLHPSTVAQATETGNLRQGQDLISSPSLEDSRSAAAVQHPNVSEMLPQETSSRRRSHELQPPTQQNPSDSSYTPGGSGASSLYFSPKNPPPGRDVEEPCAPKAHCMASSTNP